MITIKFEDLSAEAQEKILQLSRSDVEKRFGDSIRHYCEDMGADYDTLIDTEMLKNLYSFEYVFHL